MRCRCACLRERGVLCSGKCCHRVGGERWGRGQPCSKAHSPLVPVPAQKKFEIVCWPFWCARAIYRMRDMHEACVISQYSGQLIPHTKISVHSIDTLTQDSPCSWRGYMSTKSDPNLRTPLATRARPLSCRARIRSQITEAPRYMRRPCRPGSRRPSCSRRSPASGTSRMVFWM